VKYEILKIQAIFGPEEDLGRKNRKNEALKMFCFSTNRKVKNRRVFCRAAVLELLMPAAGRPRRARVRNAFPMHISPAPTAGGNDYNGRAASSIA